MGYTQEWKQYQPLWTEAHALVWKEGSWFPSTHTTSFHNAYKKNSTTFSLLYAHPYMKSLHRSDKTQPDQLQTLPIQLELILVVD